ncbi:uncharacterized protein MYCFIDRAFT_173376 [Pseudocercospora fijiensis CIRAD86]|uniref:Uncharacterized protein n=1 Tax=Pseudocercospora fijiensis (strain CIRAD86) TaxID=383855 RepID=M2Z3G7_PSEFD|nr:uncharacterized protein MYCFIDRAFT_173376 [Pseudocercospora fijiensis CIRAD86]EME84375.1 hypothetical protein MYCFIDRAFT_173376 [Pseudocercospora fijiensis CIRAD86]
MGLLDIRLLSSLLHQPLPHTVILAASKSIYEPCLIGHPTRLKVPRPMPYMDHGMWAHEGNKLLLKASPWSAPPPLRRHVSERSSPAARYADDTHLDTPEDTRPESSEDQLPATIDGFFTQHGIRLTQHASGLPSLANNLSGQLHPLLSDNIRRLDLHVKVSLRPIHNPTSAYGKLVHVLSPRKAMIVVDQHIERLWDNVPMLLSQLPRLRQFSLTLDSLFDSTPRPRDYQRLRLFRNNRLWGSRSENLQNSDFQEKATAVLIPLLRGLARGKELDRVAIRHVPVATLNQLEVISGEHLSDEEVARAFLIMPGREVVLKGLELGRKDSFLDPPIPDSDKPPPPPAKTIRPYKSTPHLQSSPKDREGANRKNRGRLPLIGGSHGLSYITVLVLYGLHEYVHSTMQASYFASNRGLLNNSDRCHHVLLLRINFHRIIGVMSELTTLSTVYYAFAKPVGD